MRSIFSARSAWCLAAAALVVAPLVCASREARAEVDHFGVGTGADGALVVTSPIVVNDYVEVVADTGSAVLQTSPTNGKFAPGDLVMIYAATGKTPIYTELPEIQQPVTFFSTGTGRYELARVASVTAASITLTKPLVEGVSANVTQVVRVPEYTTVDITGAGVIRATPWDGAKGGVIAFLASDAVHVAGGGIDATLAGFRGGAAASGQTSTTDSTSFDADPSPMILNAQKGEGCGLETFGPAFVGRGNRYNGGGGGNSLRAGGGGGGHGGRGGRGGNATSGAEAGGLGGVSLEYEISDQLLFGGGGGAGHAPSSASSGGATGGGAVLIRGKTLQLDTLVRSNGASPGPAIGAGAGGGSAGGALVLRFTTSITCAPGALLQARGGLGGSTQTLEGPGGGGAGGRVLLQAESIGATCQPDTDGAYYGGNLLGMANGATAGSTGAQKKIVAGFCGVDADCPVTELCDFSIQACDPGTDIDHDTIPNATDNCVHEPNPSQADTDMDGVGDACEPPPEPPPDADGDGATDAIDNCPTTPNPDQADADGDGTGDACEPPPVACVEDDACGDASSGVVCVSGQCAMGCRGEGGNGCPADQICSSADDLPGTCSPATPTTAAGGYDPDGTFVGGNGVACAMGPSPARGLPLFLALTAGLFLIRRLSPRGRALCSRQ